MIVPVILSGGSGTRLWPLSRETYPKQFLPLIGSLSLFQETVNRFQSKKEFGPPILVCNEKHRFLVAEQMQSLAIEQSTILLEPVARNTAPATACAAFSAITTDPDAVLLVLPADHLVRDLDAFHQALALGATAAKKGSLVTFGIVPNKPEIGFGYIQRGEAQSWSKHPNRVYAVEKFVEKPDLKTAINYLNSGSYLWNSGMFLFRADRYLEELKLYAPEMYNACQQAVHKVNVSFDFVRLDEESFSSCPKDSIDYAVMEKTDSAVVIPLQAGWNDIGSWSAIWEESQHDHDGNVIIGDVISEGCKNSFIRSDKRLVTAIGLKDIIIVETVDALFVAPKERVQDIKNVVNRLKQSKREEATTHQKVYRPWGSYESIDRSNRFQVKRITVNPGSILSLQLHHHRAEHWIVVKGTAKITRGDEVFVLGEDESTYIPLGTKHRLENPGKIPLELIEVQSGSYLGEDDIVRLDDKYGRTD